MKQRYLEDEREMRLMEMKQKWTEYTQKQQERQQELSTQDRIRSIISGSGGDYTKARDQLAAEGLLDAAKDVSGFIPDDAGDIKTVDLGDRVGIFENGNLTKTIPKGASPTTNVNWMDVFDKEGNPVGSFPSGSVPKEYQGNENYRVVKSTELTGGLADVGLEQPGGRDDARRTISGMQHALQLIDQGLDELDKSDTSTGIVGWTKRNVLDPVVQLADLALPDGVADRIYEGANISGATRVETVANFLSGQLLPAITGETSGRFTEAERAMAQQTIALLETTKSAASIRQALNDVKSILKSSIERQRGLIDGNSESPSAEAEYPSPKTQEDFDMLQSGEVYISPDDGRLYRKP